MKYESSKGGIKGTANVEDNFIDSISFTGMPCDAKKGDLFTFYKKENELYSIFISAINGINEGLPGSGFLKILGGLKDPYKEKNRIDHTIAQIPQNLNDAQYKAVENVLKYPQLYAIQGPPGTGKTDVLAVIAKLFSEQGKDVLVLCNTHQAVNNALNKISKYDQPTYKIGNEFKANNLDSKIISVESNKDFKQERKKNKGKAKGDVVGMTLCRAIINFVLQGSAFIPAIVLVDEASQITFAQASAIGAFGAGCCVFIGDDRQMPPIFHEGIKDNPLSISIFEKLQEILPSELKAVLTTSYRMNAPICRYVSENFYEPYGVQLKSYDGISDRHISDEDLADAIEFLTIKTDGCKDFNQIEAQLAAKRAMSYKTMGEEVAVITPFRKQVNLVREEWVKMGGNPNDILIDTVERLQGQDVDVIILTTSVSDEEYYKDNVLFLENPNRLNVMISRAKKKVVIIKSPLVTIRPATYLAKETAKEQISSDEKPSQQMFYIKDEPDIVTKARQLIFEEFKDLEFYEEDHKYILHGKLLPSVSGIGHRFIQDPFDEQKQAAAYAIRHGETADYWIRQWKCNSFRATTLGTKTHEFGESLGYILAGHPELIRDSVRTQYLSCYNYLAPIHPKEEAVVHFFDDLPSSYHLVLNETKVYSGKNPDESKNLKEQICGTFDMLYWYDGDGDSSKAGFVILDYKTNANLYSDYNRKNNRVLLPPFSDIIEEDYGLYIIQLNLYALMLEDIGLPVIAKKIVWLKDDGTYQIINMPNVVDLLRITL